MNELNYVILEVFPTGAQSVIAQVANSHVAIKVLEGLIQDPDNRKTYALRPVEVDAKNSVHRFELAMQEEE